MRPSCDLSHNWSVAATQMISSTELRKGESSSPIRIAAGIICGVGCFAAVVSGSLLVGRSMDEMLRTVEMSTPAEIDPLR